eukprot:322508-Chlamydomonas_euryale.AAC.1
MQSPATPVAVICKVRNKRFKAWCCMCYMRCKGACAWPACAAHVLRPTVLHAPMPQLCMCARACAPCDHPHVRPCACMRYMLHVLWLTALTAPMPALHV